MIHYYVKVCTKAKSEKFSKKTVAFFRFHSYKKIKTYKGAFCHEKSCKFTFDGGIVRHYVQLLQFAFLCAIIS